MSRGALAALCVGLAVVFAAAVALLPLSIGNTDCGGRVGRVAVLGPFHSGNGELSPGTEVGAHDDECIARGRLILAGAAAAGALVGLGVGAVTRRRDKQPVT